MTKTLTIELHEDLLGSLEIEAQRQAVTVEMLAREYLSQALIETVRKEIDHA